MAQITRTRPRENASMLPLPRFRPGGLLGLPACRLLGCNWANITGPRQCKISVGTSAVSVVAVVVHSGANLEAEL